MSCSIDFMFRTEPKPQENSKMCGEYIHVIVISSLYTIRAKIDNRFHESLPRTTCVYLKVHSSRNCGKELNGTFAFGKHATFLDIYCNN